MSLPLLSTLSSYFTCHVISRYDHMYTVLTVVKVLCNGKIYLILVSDLSGEYAVCVVDFIGCL